MLFVCSQRLIWTVCIPRTKQFTELADTLVQDNYSWCYQLWCLTSVRPDGWLNNRAPKVRPAILFLFNFFFLGGYSPSDPEKLKLIWFHIVKPRLMPDLPKPILLIGFSWNCVKCTAGLHRSQRSHRVQLKINLINNKKRAFVSLLPS